MYVKDLGSAPKRELEGLVSHILLEEGDAPGGELSITWVGDDERDLSAGHIVFIPPNTEHGIVNTGDEVLTYISAATPAFPVTKLYDAGQISLSP